MNNLHSKIAKLSLTSLLALTLTACGSEDSAKRINDWAIDVTENKRVAEITFVNLLDEMATFYAKSKQMNRSVFDSRQQINSVLAGEAESHTFEWGLGNHEMEDSELGVADTNTLANRTSVDIKLEDTEKYWSVAWLDGINYQLSAFKRLPKITSSHYNVRIFALVDLDIKDISGNSSDASIEKGQVSEHFTIDNCFDDLSVNGTAVDICAVAEANNSYLVVVGQQGQLYVGKE